MLFTLNNLCSSVKLLSKRRGIRSVFLILCNRLHGLFIGSKTEDYPNEIKVKYQYLSELYIELTELNSVIAPYILDEDFERETIDICNYTLQYRAIVDQYDAKIHSLNRNSTEILQRTLNVDSRDAQASTSDLQSNGQVEEVQELQELARQPSNKIPPENNGEPHALQSTVSSMSSDSEDNSSSLNSYSTSETSTDDEDDEEEDPEHEDDVEDNSNDNVESAPSGSMMQVVREFLRELMGNMSE